MIKILDNTKRLDVLVNDNSNGLGQIQPLNAFITKELNGIYEADIEMLATDKHFKDINVGGILKMTVNEAQNEQMFKIYSISKPMNEVVTLHCEHITYELNKVPVKPFTATGAVGTKNGMLNNIVGNYPFTMTTNINNTTSKFTLSIPKSFRECLGGYEGSILDVFRCEYEWDNLEVKMLARLGSDNNVRIAYGKNLTDFKQEENIENVYTAVMGYAVIDEVTYTGNIYHKISATYPNVLIVDFSSDYDQEHLPTVADLTAKAQSYATNNNIEIPRVNLSISFVPLYQTEEYKNIAPLERVSLGDTVHVFFEKLGVEATARVVKTVWDVNLNRYHQIELGSAKANLNTVLNEVKQEVLDETKSNTSYIEGQLNDMAGLIINGLGLHKTNVPVEGGGYRMYLHNKPTLAESDTQYVLSAGGFLVSTDYGQTWNAGFDSQGNVVVNSLSTIVLKALEIYGSTITFGDINDKYITAEQYELNGSNVGISFDGNGYVRFKPQEEFKVENIASNGTSVINSLAMNRDTATNGAYVNIYNRDINKNYQPANRVSLNNNTNSNVLALHNYDTKNSGTTTYLGNFITFTSNATNNTIDLYNYKKGSSDIANYLYMISSSASSGYYVDNYNPTNTYKANDIALTSSGTINRFEIQNYSTNSSSIANEFILTTSLLSSTYNSSMIFRTYEQNSTTKASEIWMEKNSNFNRIYLRTFNSGSVSAELSLENDIAIIRGRQINLSINGETHSLYFQNGYIRYR